MEKNDLFDLVSKAKEKTESGIITWKAAPGSEQYKVDFAKSSIAVWKNKDKYGFSVLNFRGDIVGRLYSEEDMTDEEVETLRSLHTKVADSYYRIEETFGDVLEGLEGNSVPEEDDSPPF